MIILSVCIDIHTQCIEKKPKTYNLNIIAPNQGYPYDNAPMERYFNTLKTELIYQYNYRTETELYSAIEEFAYVHYNHVRPHSYNNYKTPFETRYGRYKPDTKN